MQPLLDKLTAIRTQYTGLPIAYTERVPEYLIAAAGLSNMSPDSFVSAIEEGNEPNPAAQSQMNDLITGRHIRLLLYNTQATSPATSALRSLAKQNNLPVVGVTETVPKGLSYQQWQLNQLDAIFKALDNRI